MKVTWSWLADWVELPPTPQALAHALAMRGFPVASIEQGSALDPSILVGRVLEVAPHPNADRLRLCVVDLGSVKLSVVCGASNVAVGQAVAVAQVGTRLPDGTKLRKTKIRGVESEGMICSERELGLSRESEGIWVIPGSPRVGTTVRDYLGPADAVLDVEITSNRTDCMSVRGLAREIASIGSTALKQAPAIRATAKAALPRVTIEDPRDCGRYMARVVQGVRVGESPEWLRRRLEATGSRSINNVVDVTNYVLRSHGQPIHAFDATKVGGGEIVVRRGRSGERLTLLDGREVEPGGRVLVIADKSRPMALAGIMGGLDSGVTGATTSVILESAHFSPELTKDAAALLGVDTDASQRFIQGVDPAGVAAALDETARLLAEVASGSVVEGSVDLWPGKAPPKRVRLRRSRLVSLLGLDVEPGTISKGLAGLELREAEPWKGTRGGEEAAFDIPTHRSDLAIEEDLIEEVARVVGYDRIPSLVRATAVKGSADSPEADIRSNIVAIGCGLGFDETLSTVLVGAVPEEVHPQADDASTNAALWEIRNPKSRELRHLRPSLLPGLLQTAARNLRHGAHSVSLMEVGKVFRASPPPLGAEWWEAALAITGPPDPWIQRGADPDRYLELKGAVDALIQGLGIDSGKTRSYHEKCWAAGTGALVEASGARLARLGQVAPGLANYAGLERPAWAAVLDMRAVAATVPSRRRFAALPKYPASKRDVAVLVSRDVTHGEVEAEIRRGGGSLLESVRLFDLYEGEQIGPGKKSLAYALEFRAADRTLHDGEVDEAVKGIVRALSASVGATLRGGIETKVAAERS